MNLVVVSQPDAIDAAIDLGRRTESATVEGVFAEVLARRVAEPGPCGPWIHLSDHEAGALRRHREVVVPRLLAIVEGRDGEGEPARTYAAALLGRLDPPLGFRALLARLGSDDPVTLSQAMDELQSILITADEDRRGRDDLVPGPAEVERILSFLDRPEEAVARKAIWLLDELEPPGVHDHALLPRMDDPVHGDSIRFLLAWKGRVSSLLERAFAALRTPGRADADREAVDMFDRFRRSGDPRNGPRALAMMMALLEGDTLLPRERETIEMYLRWEEQAVEARRPEQLAKAALQVERLVSAGIIDRVAKDRAIAALRAEEEGNHELWGYWGAIEGLRAAGVLHGVNFKGDYPPAHDELIRDLAAISRGVFRPEGVYQLRAPWLDRGHDYPVQFVHGGRLYRFDIDYMGASYDAASVLEAANEALADADVPVRFVDLGVSGPREIPIAFCDPSALEAIAGELGLKPRVPFATVVGSMARIGDASRHRIWDRIAIDIGDGDRTLSIEEIVGWRCPATGESALHREVGLIHPERIVVLLANGADVHARSSRGETPLHAAMKAKWSERPHLVKLLLEAGAEADAVAEADGETLLHRLAREDDRWTAAALLDRGASVDARVRRHPGAVSRPIACAPETVAGPGEESLECGGQTALHRAVIGGHAPVVELLLDRGADANATDDRGYTPMDLALLLGRGEPLASLLRARGGRSSD